MFSNKSQPDISPHLIGSFFYLISDNWIKRLVDRKRCRRVNGIARRSTKVLCRRSGSTLRALRRVNGTFKNLIRTRHYASAAFAAAPPSQQNTFVDIQREI